MSNAEPRPSILAEIAPALSWPPTDYSVAADWCPNCDFPLNAIDRHGRCLGYIVGAAGLPLCACPCAESRRAAGAKRKADPLRDRPQWWVGHEEECRERARQWQ